ncbi:serine protease 1 [Radiomyces spectabilis]|uniref:serine protease 1 n=1 Tax=Radiomyces spectabilis TaxID=64574 RepID=UPI00222102F2|nr:serine protease 1 [Radiomyces spectabilis]KAI8381070.1 serine protease 1 [Radiomyces spectabilis]
MKTSIIATALLLAGYAVALPLSQNEEANIAPLYVSAEAEPIQDSYIVVLKNHLNERKVEEHASWIQTMLKKNDHNRAETWLEPRVLNNIEHVYDTPSIKGYAGKFDSHLLNLIRQSDDVDYVEKDSMVYANELQRDAPWGLARISHRETLTFRDYNKYSYNSDGGKGIKVYVIDTGINVDHVDFEGRATWGKTVPVGDADEDGNGHGSHCAGTIAGKQYGVAKQAEPVAVKVLRSNGSGSMSDVVKGVDWATSEHIKASESAKASRQPFKGSVANMSLGGGKSPTLDRFVNGAVDAGIVFAVAAGNDNEDACRYSPAAAEQAITVGASTLQDDRAYFSNYGPCVDVFAPGLNIRSVWRGSKHATNTISGTSMASPHVAGLAAYFLSLEENGASPKEIKDKILQLATPNILKKIPADTPNLLIFNDSEDESDSRRRKHHGFRGGLKDLFGDI